MNPNLEVCTFTLEDFNKAVETSNIDKIYLKSCVLGYMNAINESKIIIFKSINIYLENIILFIVVININFIISLSQ